MSIQMSQHRHKEVWSVLKELVASHDHRENRDDEFLKQLIKLPRILESPENKNGDEEEKKDNFSDTGGSISLNYSHCEFLESHARLVRFDQQMMNSLSFNSENHQLFLSTPKFISDLLFASEVLKGIEKDERNPYLISLI